MHVRFCATAALAARLLPGVRRLLSSLSDAERQQADAIVAAEIRRRGVYVTGCDLGSGADVTVTEGSPRLSPDEASRRDAAVFARLGADAVEARRAAEEVNAFTRERLRRRSAPEEATAESPATRPIEMGMLGRTLFLDFAAANGYPLDSELTRAMYEMREAVAAAVVARRSLARLRSTTAAESYQGAHAERLLQATAPLAEAFCWTWTGE